MTDDQIVILLNTIKTLAVLEYPYPDDSRNDSRLIMALGEIAGTAIRAVASYMEDHPK